MKYLNNFKKIFFTSDPIPYNIMCMNDNYVIVSRKLDLKQDIDILQHSVDMNAYISLEDAYRHNKDNPIYSIIDRINEKRGTDNLVFRVTDYFDTESCIKCLSELNSGVVSISRRTETYLDIDIEKTLNINKKLITYEQATEISLGVKWKTSECTEGSSCWCRIIEPIIKIEDQNDNEIYIAGSGSIPKGYAEHLVELHNKSLNN